MSECPATVVEDVADALVELDTDVVRRYDDAVFYMDALGHRRGAGVDLWAGADCTLDLTLALRALGERSRCRAWPECLRPTVLDLPDRGNGPCLLGLWA